MIEVDDLLGDILTFKPADVGLTAQDTLFAPLSPSEYLSDSSSHTLGVVRCHIEIVRAASFLETRSSTGYDGQSCTDSFDNRNAKALIE